MQDRSCYGHPTLASDTCCAATAHRPHKPHLTVRVRGRTALTRAPPGMESLCSKARGGGKQGPEQGPGGHGCHPVPSSAPGVTEGKGARPGEGAGVPTPPKGTATCSLPPRRPGTAAVPQEPSWVPTAPSPPSLAPTRAAPRAPAASPPALDQRFQRHESPRGRRGLFRHLPTAVHLLLTAMPTWRPLCRRGRRRHTREPAFPQAPGTWWSQASQSPRWAGSGLPGGRWRPAGRPVHLWP